MHNSASPVRVEKKKSVIIIGAENDGVLQFHLNGLIYTHLLQAIETSASVCLSNVQYRRCIFQWKSAGVIFYDKAKHYSLQ